MLAGLRNVSRDLDPDFISDVSQWKEQEKKFTDEVIKELEVAISEMASSNEGWRKYLKIYAEAPTYSLMNRLLATAQLSRKGVDSKGYVLSESAWKALGRRVKSEFAKPIAKRDRAFGYDRDRSWEQKYAVEMLQPLGFNGFTRAKKDSNGNPVMDSNGQPKTEFIPVDPKGYKTFIGYHQDSTEALDGGDPPPLGGDEKPDWADAAAEGNEHGAGKLLAKVQTICRGEDVDCELRGLGTEQPGAIRDPATGKVTINTDAPITEQATVGLRYYFQSKLIKDDNRDSEEVRRKQDAAAESAKYVIASLYGLDSDEQAFPHLADIAESAKGLNSLSSMIHRQVSGVMGYLDPVARARSHEDKKQRESRATRRKSARKSRPKKKSTA